MLLLYATAQSGIMRLFRSENKRVTYCNMCGLVTDSLHLFHEQDGLGAEAGAAAARTRAEAHELAMRACDFLEYEFYDYCERLVRQHPKVLQLIHAGTPRHLVCYQLGEC